MTVCRAGKIKRLSAKKAENLDSTALACCHLIPVVGVEPTLQRNTILSRARLPIPPHRHIIKLNLLFIGLTLILMSIYRYFSSLSIPFGEEFLAICSIPYSKQDRFVRELNTYTFEEADKHNI